MNELFLLKSGEIALKGLNRSAFEDLLIKNCKRVLRDLGKFKFYKAQSTIYAEPLEPCDMDEAFLRLSRARIVEKDFHQIQQAAADYLGDALGEAASFKVTARRSDKSFPLNSPEICRQLGGFLLQRFPHLRVDVENPDIRVVVEVRDFAAYVHQDQQTGAGGIPVSSSGNAMLLLSGGIDSPVAGYMMAKRGLRVHAIHFATPPYTSERGLLKVKELARRMSYYCERIPLFTVPFTELSESMKEHCPEEYNTIVMRRFMMRIAQRVARENDCGALITGESVGQVASQTMQSLACTEAAVELPVLRPVVGMDKEEIIAIARRIDTFETSVLPYDDCCTVFTPRRPKTKPRLGDVLAAEAAMPDAEAMMERAVAGTGKELIGHSGVIQTR